MQPIERFFRILFLLIKHMPPVSLWRLLMPVVFISSWTILNLFAVMPATAFVYSGVFAASVQVWARLPKAMRRGGPADGVKVATAISVLAVFFPVIALQFWVLDPDFSQRTLSFVYILVCLMNLWAICDDELAQLWAPIGASEKHLEEVRSHIFKLNILTAVLAIAINESLIAVAAPLGVRVSALAMLPIAMHYFFEATLRLSAPRVDQTKG